MTQILVLSPADMDPQDKQIESGLTDSGTKIVQRFVSYPSCPPIGAHDWVLADLAILTAGQRAGAEEFNAVCLSDFGDYGANALRSILDIPVITAGRASMLYALTLGARFTVLATERDGTRVRKLVHEYGLGSQCAGVHKVTSSGHIPPAIRDADVLVVAGAAHCAGLDDIGIPIVKPFPLLPKLAESLTGLGLTHSRRAYPVPQFRRPDLIDAIGQLKS